MEYKINDWVIYKPTGQKAQIKGDRNTPVQAGPEKQYPVDGYEYAIGSVGGEAGFNKVIAAKESELSPSEPPE
ncbi:MAG: hypothetical protein KA149_09215 [Chitinophagales bacterium]|nr:hypothetical protein [Chitinophagales bacterium]